MSEDRVARLERAILDLIQALIVDQQGMDGNWGNPPTIEELRRIRSELDGDRNDGQV